MADELVQLSNQSTNRIFRRFQDMGDGTHAEVVAGILTDENGEPYNAGNPVPVNVTIGGVTPRIVAEFDMPADATQFTAGDLIANSMTAASVVPVTFELAGIESGRVTGCRCVVTPASGNLVITALDFSLYLFRPETNIPFAAAGYPANNGVWTATQAMYEQLIGILRFSNGQWTNQLGTIVAGTVGYQSVSPTSRPFFPFNVDGLTDELRGLVRADSAWNPGAVVNNFHFALDVDPD